jgi:hypothetical protein
VNKQLMPRLHRACNEIGKAVLALSLSKLVQRMMQRALCTEEVLHIKLQGPAVHFA